MDVVIKEKTETSLYLCRSPSSRSWALFGGILSLVLGAAISGYESIVWKLTYVTAALVIGLSYMDEYEECLIDKETGKIEFCQESVLQRYLLKYWNQTSKVVANLSELEDIVVEEDLVGAEQRKAYHVIFKFTNYSIPISQAAAVGDGSPQEKTAQCVRQFLGMNPAPPIVSQPTNQDRPSQLPLVHDDDVILPEDSSASSSDEGFEKVDKSELVDTPTDLLDTPPAVTTPTESDEQVSVVDPTRD